MQTSITVYWETYRERKIQTHTRKLDAQCETQVEETGVWNKCVYNVFMLSRIQSYSDFAGLSNAMLHDRHKRAIFIIWRLPLSTWSFPFSECPSVSWVGTSIQFCISDEFTEVICFIFVIDTILRNKCIEKIAMQAAECWYRKQDYCLSNPKSHITEVLNWQGQFRSSDDSLLKQIQSIVHTNIYSSQFSGKIHHFNNFYS